MQAGDSALVEKAQSILEGNWMGSYTRPSAILYPHQWSWDSGFIAIGYSTFDLKRGRLELESLFKGQWKNGMVPHMVFNPKPEGEYFPDAGFWSASLSENSPDGILTSGITQPPVHAIAALCIYKRASDKVWARSFLNEMFPKLVASHRFFYEERDPRGEGLIYLRHPWESGVDNSPTWDVPLRKIPIGRAPEFKRKDIKFVSASQRPRQEDYDRYIYLVELFKNHRYHEGEILDNCPFIVQDILVNSILVKANQDLADIGEVLGEDVSEIKGWKRKTKRAINSKLWHSGHGFYDAYDFGSNSIIEVDTASGFCPLYAGVPSKSRAKRLFDYLDSASFCSMHRKKCFSIPNYNMEGVHFDPVNYWRGPVWINMNWMLEKGLRNYGFQEKAESVRSDIIELVRRYGFFEYYDPLKGSGYGSNNFSWTAALFLDEIYMQGGYESTESGGELT